MNYRIAVRMVGASASKGKPSALACRPRCWAEPCNERIIPHGGYLTLLPSIDGTPEWYILWEHGGGPVRAEFDPDSWLLLTDREEWEVFPLPGDGGDHEHDYHGEGVPAPGREVEKDEGRLG